MEGAGMARGGHGEGAGRARGGRGEGAGRAPAGRWVDCVVPPSRPSASPPASPLRFVPPSGPAF